MCDNFFYCIFSYNSYVLSLIISIKKSDCLFVCISIKMVHRSLNVKMYSIGKSAIMAVAGRLDHDFKNTRGN